MPIECYHTGCRNHSANHGDDDGPFCFEIKCAPNYLPGSYVNIRGYVIHDPYMSQKLVEVKIILADMTDQNWYHKRNKAMDLLLDD